MKIALGPVMGLVLACVALVGCDQSAHDQAKKNDPVLATVNGEQIRQSEINDIYDNLPAQYRQLPVEFLQDQLVERLIKQKLVADAARKAGLDEDPIYKQRLKQAKEQILEDLYMRRKVDEAITPERLKAAYEAHPAKEYKASHILVKTKEEAEDIIKQLDNGADFAKIAKEKSQDPGSGARGGELGYFQPDQMVPEFAKAVTALKPGEVSKEPVRSQFGWHVIKVEDIRPVSFEDSKDQLKEELADKVREEILADLRAKAKIVKPEPPAADKDEAPAAAKAPAAGQAPAATPAPAPAQDKPADGK
ncbi:MAG: peptidylprolyl isomerase [Alphaproteobacteria bacterium]|nr:peptidylprolyl isomerase [Alphaproteobacteria bacterium]